jgi:DNA helicase-2/ATP-dependent DNA helicase PcrA
MHKPTGPAVMNLLDNLNPQQREAVLATEGPLLILAGAGTGKTRVITYRIAYLIDQGTPPNSILAVTFTNKAADQMRDRVRALLESAGHSLGEPSISTFHSFCGRLLRREAARLGLPRNFAIYDADDQQAAIKLALSSIGIEDPGETPRALLERISSAKNHAIAPDEALAKAYDEPTRTAARVYKAYEKTLRNAGALDFDDLLLRAAEVLRRFDDARAAWQQRFRFLHVDEYQDTNRVQYDLLRLLAGPRPNLCVVGDEDQSIYRWRGADIGNILRFAEDFPGARVLRIEQNYRSHQNILDAAGAVVAHNQKRIGKQLEATRGKGANLVFFEARDAKAEADYVAAQVSRLQLEDSATHLAVLYRTNAQSRSFEESFRGRGIRYRLLGGFSFYERAEVKDVLAYVRLAIFPGDDVALLRVLNTPPRGIGKVTIDALRSLAREKGSSLWDALATTLEAGGSRALAPLRGFRELIEELRQKQESLSPVEFLQAVLDDTGYIDMLRERETEEDIARLENLRELVNALAEGAERGETLEDFLDRAALVSDADDFDDHAPVTLLTLHTAKGLEFDHVFLTGLEEGTFPHNRTLNDPEQIEEERRLCYVGMTRARDTLTLTRAVYRRIYGSERLQASTPSRFLLEIPSELVDTAEGSLAEAGQTRRYEPDPEYSYSTAEFSRRARGSAPPYASPGSTARPSRAAGSSPRRARSDANPLIGQRVRHPTYGLGTIIGVDGEDEERKLTVSFSGHGTKKLLERFANLSWA